MASNRFAVIDQSRCVACGACVKECPRNAIRIWHGCYAVVESALCVGCGKCRKTCPADTIDIKQREAAQ